MATELAMPSNHPILCHPSPLPPPIPPSTRAITVFFSPESYPSFTCCIWLLGCCTEHRQLCGHGGDSQGAYRTSFPRVWSGWDSLGLWALKFKSLRHHNDIFKGSKYLRSCTVTGPSLSGGCCADLKDLAGKGDTLKNKSKQCDDNKARVETSTWYKGNLPEEQGSLKT